MGQHTIPLYGNGQEPYDTIDSAYEYDDANRLTNATFATAAVTAYEYDPADRLLKRMPPNNAVTNFSYDPAGRLIGIHDRNPGLDENGYLEG
jgi:YD repeat-containing protein